MRIIDIEEAKASLSQLVESAATGEPFIISRDGKSLVTVEPIAANRTASHRFGFMAGRFEIPDDFDTMFADEIEAMFNGEDEPGAAGDVKGA
jgi:antitoxin (DNA-binding transcriptional repressor) of toxin-antitoxin stability system